jgi:hypothetical protein
MAFSHSANWIPTIEFQTQEKCEAAAAAIVKQADAHTNWGNIKTPWCAKIEK